MESDVRALGGLCLASLFGGFSGAVFLQFLAMIAGRPAEVVAAVLSGAISTGLSS